MQMWKTSSRVFLVSNITSYREMLAHFSTKSLSQHSWRAFLCPRDSVLDGRNLCNKFKKIGLSMQHNRASTRDTNHKPTKTKGRLSQPHMSLKTKGKLSPELQKLRFEDLRETKTVGVLKYPVSKEKEPLEIVFGVAPCFLALTQGRRKAHRLFVKNGGGQNRETFQNVCQEAVRQGVVIHRVDKKALDKMCSGKVHQGLCLEASPLEFITGDRLMVSHEVKKPKPLWLILDGVQDPMNLGAILRTTYYLGVDRIVCSIHNSCPLTPTVSKASSGVMEIMKVFGHSNLKMMVEEKMNQGWQVVGTVGFEEAQSQTKVLACSEFRISGPTLLLMGGEGYGLSPELRELCILLHSVLYS
ncbi:hypothetical protein DNTS_021291 [Danionella cerebrum]|uniref:rRNA methyltransferase 1, mitochondrial n=1 Tax=Danionella cerebrum TaxID=2873325 RepID=A0A553MMB6_9TELE|nr:hypothetical protein DNTS_021291 [Danionella translucida]